MDFRGEGLPSRPVSSDDKIMMMNEINNNKNKKILNIKIKR